MNVIPNPPKRPRADRETALERAKTQAALLQRVIEHLEIGTAESLSVAVTLLDAIEMYPVRGAATDAAQTALGVPPLLSDDD